MVDKLPVIVVILQAVVTHSRDRDPEQDSSGPDGKQVTNEDAMEVDPEPVSHYGGKY